MKKDLSRIEIRQILEDHFIPDNTFLPVGIQDIVKDLIFKHFLLLTSVIGAMELTVIRSKQGDIANLEHENKRLRDRMIAHDLAP